MFTQKAWAYFMSLTLAMAITSCNDSDDEVEDDIAISLEEYTLIANEKIENSSLEVEFYASEELYAGYNLLAFKVKDESTGNYLNDAAISFVPLMDMSSGMTHSTPISAPVYDSEMEAYLASASFIMPTTQNGDWEIQIEITQAGTNEPVSINIPITVTEKEEPRMISFVAPTPDSTIYYVALAAPHNPEVGLNNYNLAIYKRASMMEYPYVDDLTVEIEPEMPTMNHGSPNNVNPVHTENGMYQGTVNFTMTGYWKVNMTFKDKGGAMISNEAYFDITFQ